MILEAGLLTPFCQKKPLLAESEAMPQAIGILPVQTKIITTTAGCIWFDGAPGAIHTITMYWTPGVSFANSYKIIDLETTAHELQDIVRLPDVPDRSRGGNCPDH